MDILHLIYDDTSCTLHCYAELPWPNFQFHQTLFLELHCKRSMKNIFRRIYYFLPVNYGEMRLRVLEFIDLRIPLFRESKKGINEGRTFSFHILKSHWTAPFGFSVRRAMYTTIRLRDYNFTNLFSLLVSTNRWKFISSYVAKFV